MLVSDAGAPFAMQVDRGTLWHKQVLRALDIATDQSRGLRKRLMFAEVATAEGRKAAYWGIDQDGVKNAAPGGLPCPPEVTGKIAKIRTRLDRFSAKEQGQLINWGYAACDNAMRRFAATDAPAPTAWPVPKYALG
jgi:NTE family protein